jgi:micrococcal nuclease
MTQPAHYPGQQAHRSWRVIGAALALSTLASSCSAELTAATAHADADITATVLRVIDGDTIDLADDRRGRLRVRVLGMDTPEATTKVGCWGPQATEFAKSTLGGVRVAIITDPTQDLHDRYGRTLAYVEKAGGWNYSIEAARSGSAHAYVYDNSPGTRAPEIAAAEQEAKAAGRGLWGPPCFGRTDPAPRS